MEKELNIAEILKDKPKGIKLWSPAFGQCKLCDVALTFSLPIDVEVSNGTHYYLLEDTRIYKDGKPMLFPSEEMRDWEKFAWKKGDVLSNGTGNLCIFDSWHSSNYTSFKAFYATPHYSNKVFGTKKWTKETDKKIIKQYIFNIELYYGGKLNLETLEIEKCSEPVLKDGDFITIACNSGEGNYIAIYRSANIDTKIMSTYAYFLIDNIEGDKVYYAGNFRLDDCFVLPATDKEKQQILNVLANEGKTWDAEDKQIVFHPILPCEEKKCEFQPFDKVLVRDVSTGCWRSAFFVCFDNDSGIKGNYIALTLIGGHSNHFHQCIPYNEETKHLLDTTDDWKGGEK